jgi:hypothetical protein
MFAATQTMRVNELNIFALQPSEGFIPVHGTHGKGCSSELCRFQGQPSTFLRLANIRQQGGESQPGVKLSLKAAQAGRLSSFKSLSFARRRSQSRTVLQPARNRLANMAKEGLGILNPPNVSREKLESWFNALVANPRTLLYVGQLCLSPKECRVYIYTSVNPRISILGARWSRVD